MSHDLRVFKALAYKVIVLCNGEIVEYGFADRIFSVSKVLTRKPR
ncbi:microcin C ABC transporter ATP-binding protein YejF [Bartonella vinsonii]|uniref:Microcin C ABC transporter ATP-binding protein YejF n=1 Tax=Bartonella vinsonii TaxID=33047 RepID=A0A3S5ATX0_BARVI|nr:microcin C ABC transporter ATP-binding protein YejF [Bartonella vinsonii]